MLRYSLQVNNDALKDFMEHIVFPQIRCIVCAKFIHTNLYIYNIIKITNHNLLCLPWSLLGFR